MKNKVIRVVAILMTMIIMFGNGVYADEMKSTVGQEELKSIYEIREAMNTILNNYVGGTVSREELTEAALKGMFKRLDPYSTHYNKMEYMQFIESISGEFIGIGIKIQKKENYVAVIDVLEKTPAEKAGIIPGDLITKIEKEDVTTMSMDTVLSKIKGTAGTKVNLTIKRGDELLNKSVGRDLIQINPIKVKKIKEIFKNATDKEDKYIRYMQIFEFNSQVANEFKRELEKMDDERIRGVIIDLRDNPGGYLDQVIKMCAQIIPKGPIVHTVDKQGKKVTFSSTQIKNAPFDIVVLVNNNSASASEIMASAIKDSKSGILVGERTYGKGVVQKMLQDGYGNYYKLTVEEYLTRNGTHINKVGIEPDIVIEIPEYLDKMKSKYKIGDSDPEIKQIEKILVYLGYGVTNIDETYDQNTHDAVMKYQADNNLFPYGIADYTTQKSLNRSIYEKEKVYDKQLEGAFEIIKNKVFKK